MTNGSTLVLSPRYDEIRKLQSSQKLVSKNIKLYEDIIGKENDWQYTQPKPKPEGLTEDQKQKLAFYDSLAQYFGGTIPADLQDQWNKLKGRPDTTQENYQKLLDNQEKHTDYDTIKGTLQTWIDIFGTETAQQIKAKLDAKPTEHTLTEKEQEAINNYEKIKENLNKWTTAFPNLEPNKVKEKYDALPTTDLTDEQKEAIREYAGLKEKNKELEKRPTLEALNQAVQDEKNKYKDYDTVKKNLEEWTKQFGNKTPEMVQKEIGSKPTNIPTDFIFDKVKIRELIERLLWETQDRWRKYLESDDKNVFDKDPVLGLDFEQHEGREQGSKIVNWIIRALADKSNPKKISYEQLAYYWCSGKEENFSGKLADIKYNGAYDYDAGSLRLFLKYLGLLSENSGTTGIEDSSPIIIKPPLPSPVDSKDVEELKTELKKWTTTFPFPETPQTIKDKCDRLQKVIDYEKAKMNFNPQ